METQAESEAGEAGTMNVSEGENRESRLTWLQRVLLVVLVQLQFEAPEVWPAQRNSCTCAASARIQQDSKELRSLLRLSTASPDPVQHRVLHVPHLRNFGKCCELSSLHTVHIVAR